MLRPHDFDAVVVGSGVAGSVTAAILADEGARVLVLEKNPVAGGSLATSTRDGFRLDATGQLVARGSRGPVGAVLRRLGLTRPRLLTHPVPLRLRGMLDLRAPSSAAGLPALMRETAVQLGLSWRERARLLGLWAHVHTLTAPELRVWDRRTLDELIRRHTRDARTHFLAGLLGGLLFALPPWELSAGEAIRSLRRIAADYRPSYVEGGLGALVERLLDVVRARGGAVLTERRVVSIESPGHGPLRVGTADGTTFRTKAVAVSTAPADLLALLVDVDIPDAYRARVASLKPSRSVHQLRIGLSQPLLEEGSFVALASSGGLTIADLSHDLMRRLAADLGEGRLCEPLPLFGTVPSNFDPTLAPPGQQLLAVNLRGPEGPDPVDPPEAWRAQALDALAVLVPGFRESLVFADFVPVAGRRRWRGRTCPALISTGQHAGQVGADRLPVATPVPGLFLCGDGAGGHGVGIELAVTSALSAARGVFAHVAST